MEGALTQRIAREHELAAILVPDRECELPFHQRQAMRPPCLPGMEEQRGRVIGRLRLHCQRGRQIGAMVDPEIGNSSQGAELRPLPPRGIQKFGSATRGQQTGRTKNAPGRVGREPMG